MIFKKSQQYILKVRGKDSIGFPYAGHGNSVHLPNMSLTSIKHSSAIRGTAVRNIHHV